jgi:hypothetical protein
MNDLAHAATETKLLAVWQGSIRLERAALQLAPAELRAKWDALAKVNALTAAQQAVEAAKAQTAGWQDLLMAAMTGSNTVLAPRLDLKRTAENLLADHLKSGALIGLGFQPPRRLHTLPDIIPARHWHGCPHFDNATLHSEGLHFIEIRVITPQRLQSLSAMVPTPAPVLSAPPHKAPGRPTIRQHVEAAFETLARDGKINPDQAARSHYPLLRQAMAQSGMQRAAQLSDEGIRPHFAPLFKALCESRKQ